MVVMVCRCGALVFHGMLDGSTCLSVVLKLVVSHGLGTLFFFP